MIEKICSDFNILRKCWSGKEGISFNSLLDKFGVKITHAVRTCYIGLW
jgi:hypothetical protein